MCTSYAPRLLAMQPRQQRATAARFGTDRAKNGLVPSPDSLGRVTPKYYELLLR